MQQTTPASSYETVPLNGRKYLIQPISAASEDMIQNGGH